MAIITTPNGHGMYADETTRDGVIRYILNPDKVRSGYWGGASVDLTDPVGYMEKVAQRFGKDSGVRLRHFVISFHPLELDDAETADEIAKRVVDYIGQEYPALYGVHEDKEHLHFHIAMNAVSHGDGHRYRGSKREFYALLNAIKDVLEDYGIFSLHYVSAYSK